MVDLDDRVLDFILFRKWELHSDEQDVSIKSFEEFLCCRAVCLNSVQAGAINLC